MTNPRRTTRGDMIWSERDQFHRMDGPAYKSYHSVNYWYYYDTLVMITHEPETAEQLKEFLAKLI